ncbi:radical SAM protein [Fulvivirga sp. 29W222]|uniref:Radical SAM protein n=1 Tax=Fulvivirga marina TaxID=2494733 RepID=A0A937G2G2_9BACT|nr:B12-binding domain-containing radical SAM protein [Fulvivirga marina]MBL6448755.1 radical SAM protein [Fulvivirga marina]
MKTSILLITPPFTQINTPYPATAYIKGFLNTQGITSHQSDLGMEVVLEMFSKEGLKSIFSSIRPSGDYSDNALRMISLQTEYISTIVPVIRFLQHKNPTLAYNICEGGFLPEAGRFDQLNDMEWAFGALGIQDKARHLATLYLEDLADLIKETVDPHFGFSRYAERLGRSATSFDTLEETLTEEPSFVDKVSTDLLQKKIESLQPSMVCLSIPFPGNLYGGLRCGKFIKENYPDIKVVMGGGFPNTELRSLTDSRVFNYVDYITLDDGERPLLNLLEYIDGKRDAEELKRTFLLQNSTVNYINGGKEGDIPFNKTGTPDYTDLPLDLYLSVIEMVNPMHRLWSDGRWNKLTMAHGCYWKKCSFCDISLDYINNYVPINAALLCDRMEEMIEATGETGFHFVDEAAPPALMKEMALEILKRNLKLTWWANIRFEKSFTADLCKLLKASGCIAVSGGLEVASDRLLMLMKKGVTVSQVAQVTENFTASGIMVHAYLMYGFPTQTAQETIDSLEMVRQLFFNGVIQSGFWHLFAMTAHSPVGLEPNTFGVVKVGPETGAFANNDLIHNDPSGCDHEQFGHGLSKALYNYMHGVGFEMPLQDWFDFKVPRTTIPYNFIERAIDSQNRKPLKEKAILVWLGNAPTLEIYKKKKKGKSFKAAKLHFHNKSNSLIIHTSLESGKWLQKALQAWIPSSAMSRTLAETKVAYQKETGADFNTIIQSQAWKELRKEGLLLI